MDTWWQTETGGFLITPLPITPLNRVSHVPVLWSRPKILRENGSECEVDEGGSLVITSRGPAC